VWKKPFFSLIIKATFILFYIIIKKERRVPSTFYAASVPQEDSEIL
jgi:hypothetical protein